jgi:DNA-binding FrmR family transcriptional regulator
MDDETRPHASHADVVRRLKRADGHLRAVVEMIEAGRPCLDIAQQLSAVEKAVGEAKRILIRDHIDHCLEAAAGPAGTSGRAALDEFREITRYL